MNKRKLLFIAVFCLSMMAAGCGKTEALPQEVEKAAEDLQKEELAEEAQEAKEAASEPGKTEMWSERGTPFSRKAASAEKEEAEEGTAETETVEKEIAETAEGKGGKLIVIDAGHQRKGNREKEPIGPNATQMKAKVSSGTQGRTSGIPEYELNLQVALKLKDELLNRGYQVLMVRETHDVDISNSERAAVANDANADAFIRIHANGSDDPSVNGILTICPTKNNPYCSEIYEASSLLAAKVLDATAESTGARKKRVWETDTMSGINWCKVPVTIVEMGYMTNREEDLKLAEDDYRDKLAAGMADGIDAFFREQ